MKDDLLKLQREGLPDLLTLGTIRRPLEQPLQWMFMHRGFFAEAHEHVLWRELPTSCKGQVRKGASDLLVFDTKAKQAVIVELKCETAKDPLTASILEALWHWAFNVQHLSDFNSLLLEFGHASAYPPRVAFAAPEGYYRATAQQRRKPRQTEYDTALEWVACLRRLGVVDIRLYQIQDNWVSFGTSVQYVPLVLRKGDAGSQRKLQNYSAPAALVG
jgi:hypothetical protein